MSAIVTRRRFLQATAAATAGAFVFGFHFPALARGDEASTDDQAVFKPNAWIRIAPDNTVTVVTARSEMGQGVMTALPMLIAEELEVDLRHVQTEWAPADPAYVNPAMGIQATGGSNSVRGAWKPLREAGAAARMMLIAAAAEKWGVSEKSCRARDGAVLHPASGRRATYGELAESAAQQPVPATVTLKNPSQFRVIGHPVARLDVPPKCDGSAVFGIDVRITGMLTAVVARPPVFGGSVASFDATKAKSMRGVHQIVQIDSGIGVLADGYWPAHQARAVLDIKWNPGKNADLGSDSLRARFVAAAVEDGAVARDQGEAKRILSTHPHLIEAEYDAPYEAHATMEPMNCTAHVRDDRCDIWVPTQAQGPVQQTAMKVTGLSADKIHVHTTYLGGGFGRRFEQDFVIEALQLSRAARAPVQVIFAREDDMTHDYYRPATYNRLRAVLGKSGKPNAWQHRIVGPSIMSRVMPDRVKSGIDPTSVEGAANLPYAIPNIHVDYVMDNAGAPVGFWRSVGASQNIFITESFIDELAHAAKADPYRYRRELLRDAPRHRAVLDLAAKQAGWGKRLPAGRYRGIAVGEAFGSYVAEVAEVSIDKDRNIRVHRVVCAIDCGVVVNPDTVAAQMESGIIFGLTAALKGKITLARGAVVQTNFDSYPLVRLNEAPHIEVHIVKSKEGPQGVGEPAVPPLAPAVANAVFAATGKRIRSLPITLEA